jgi:hypothetical protein
MIPPAMIIALAIWVVVLVEVIYIVGRNRVCRTFLIQVGFTILNTSYFC